MNGKRPYMDYPQYRAARRLVHTFNIFKWIFKTFVATYLLTNCFTIVMAVFDVAQNVVSQSAGVINGNMDVTAALADLETQLEAMGILGNTSSPSAKMHMFLNTVCGTKRKMNPACSVMSSYSSSSPV